MGLQMMKEEHENAKRRGEAKGKKKDLAKSSLDKDEVNDVIETLKSKYQPVYEHIMTQMDEKKLRQELKEASGEEVGNWLVELQMMKEEHEEAKRKKKDLAKSSLDKDEVNDVIETLKSKYQPV